jgi:mono/diheme cytochrome c family protein
MKFQNIKETVAVLAVISIIIAQASCYYPKTKPGWEYMPDMANAISFETYSPNPFYPDSMEARPPVTGTIPRGAYMPFHFSPNPTGYDSAGLMLHFPSWVDTSSLPEGSHLFGIYCAVCHGFDGKADGSIVTSTKIKNPFPPPPSYFDSTRMALPEGKMYYSVHYGKNLMGPYSKVLDHDQVWKVVYYVKSLQHHYTDSIALAKQKAVASAAKTDSTKKK